MKIDKQIKITLFTTTKIKSKVLLHWSKKDSTRLGPEFGASHLSDVPDLNIDSEERH